jgi:hypothetical protein
LDDAILQQARKVGGGRDMKARPNFFGDGAATGKLPPFEHENTAPRARQISRRYQAVVPGSSYDDVKPHETVARLSN